MGQIDGAVSTRAPRPQDPSPPRPSPLHTLPAHSLIHRATHERVILTLRPPSKVLLPRSAPTQLHTCATAHPVVAGSGAATSRSQPHWDPHKVGGEHLRAHRTPLGHRAQRKDEASDGLACAPGECRRWRGVPRAAPARRGQAGCDTGKRRCHRTRGKGEAFKQTPLPTSEGRSQPTKKGHGCVAARRSGRGGCRVMHGG